MKTLAPFVFVCLALVALVAWELRSVTRATQTVQRAPTERVTAKDATPDRTPPAVSRPAQTGLPHRPDKFLPPAASSPAPTTHMTGNQRQAVPPVATQSVVRWASDARWRRAKMQRFHELRELLNSEPYNEAALEAALELARELGWSDETCDLLGRLARLRPEDPGLRFELGTELMRSARWLEAIPQLRSVLKQQPEHPRAWYNLAVAHQALGHLHDARVAWDRVAQLLPENPDVFAHRGEVLLDLREWSAAEADFKTVLRLEPDSIDAGINRSAALSGLGRLEEARQALLPLLARHPRHVLLLNRLAEIAWALYQRDPVGNAALSNETAKFCRRSLAVLPDQPEITALLKRAAAAGR